MAAKLKKRALAEFGSQVVMTSPDEVSSLLEPAKRLKLSMRHSISADSDSDQSINIDVSTPESRILLELVRFSGQVSTTASPEQLQASARRIEEILPSVQDSCVRQRLVLVLGQILASGKLPDVDEKPEEIVKAASKEQSSKVVSAYLQAALLINSQVSLSDESRQRMFSIGEKLLLSSANPILHCYALAFLSSLVKPEDEELSRSVSNLCGSFSMSQDARVRTAAFHGLLTIQKLGVRLDVSMYPVFCTALTDDYEGVRCEVLKLLSQLAADDPEYQVQLEGGGDSMAGSIRLVDDVFSRICQAINDVREAVRCLAAQLIGTMTGVSQTYLEQTLDKKLMSNMRLKTSAHERQASLVSSGEWSSGKAWADDAPKEELDADSVNLVALGSCGAFVHGLEDECFSVRVAAVDSLTKLSMENHSLAVLALDFLVDMFNDEIEQVRFRAIESLTAIAKHIQLQVHQLDIILCALDDFSTLLREKLHLMLQVCSLATKDGLRAVINKLLVNLKRYPQDRRSILLTFKHLGANHPDLTLPLTTSLLDIHPFFDTPEPDIEEPSYLCTLVLVLNAAQHCPTLGPLLDSHTRRHHSYLRDTFPHLIPAATASAVAADNTAVRGASADFLTAVLKRVEQAGRMSGGRQMAVLAAASRELERLASIETAISDPASFSRMYIEAQMAYQRIITDPGWSQPNSAHQQHGALLKANIDSLVVLSLKLTSMFSGLGLANAFLTRQLKLKVLALQLVFTVCGSNQSALRQTEEFQAEYEAILGEFTKTELAAEPFLQAFKNLNLSAAKPGQIASLLKPLLPSCPPQCIKSVSLDTAQAKATIHEPVGGSETPLRCTAGLVFGIPMDAELEQLPDPAALRICLLTADQQRHLAVPRRGDLVATRPGCYRLLTTALLSHQVWSEALDVEISLVLDLAPDSGNNSKTSRTTRESLVHLCKPVKVSILPKPVRRGL